MVNLSPVWWGMSVNPAHWKTSQEDYYFKATWALSPDSISKRANQNKTKSEKLGVVAHSCNSLQETEAGEYCEFKASLSYTMSF